MLSYKIFTLLTFVLAFSTVVVWAENPLEDRLYDFGEELVVRIAQSSTSNRGEIEARRLVRLIGPWFERNAESFSIQSRRRMKFALGVAGVIPLEIDSLQLPDSPEVRRGYLWALSILRDYELNAILKVSHRLFTRELKLNRQLRRMKKEPPVLTPIKINSQRARGVRLALEDVQRWWSTAESKLSQPDCGTALLNAFSAIK